VATALYDFDNVIFDISDEPEMQGQQSWPWNSAMLDALISVDHNRHIYGETAHSASPDFTKDSRISWLPTEYISPMEKTLDDNYSDNKPIIDVETAYYPRWYAHPVEETRTEGWYGMLGGLAGLIHLNADFSTTNPSAEGTSTQKEILPQKRVLMNFMLSLDFVRMTKYTEFAWLIPRRWPARSPSQGSSTPFTYFTEAGSGRSGHKARLRAASTSRQVGSQTRLP